MPTYLWVIAILAVAVPTIVIVAAIALLKFIELVFRKADGGPDA